MGGLGRDLRPPTSTSGPPLQTADAFGLGLADRHLVGAGTDPATAAPVHEGDPDQETFWPIARDWTALARVLNAVNRSMGHADLYPFDLGPRVIAKVAYVHDLVRGVVPAEPDDPTPAPVPASA